MLAQLCRGPLSPQPWHWAARQAGAPAGIPSGVGPLRLQPSRLRASLCRLSLQRTLAAIQGQEKQGSPNG